MNYSFQELGLDIEDDDSELVKFYHFLDACARGEPEKTPAWVAQEINQLTIKDLNSAKDAAEFDKLEGCGNYFFAFWSLVMDMVEKVEADHPAMDRLAECIAELTKLPPVKVDVFMQEKMLWTDLPVIEMELLERFSSHGYGETDIPEEEKEAFLRLSSFTARMLPLGLSSTRPTETLQNTLEEEPCMDWDLEAATEYILRAGDNVFARLNDSKFTDLAYKGGSLYTGTRGMNKERWDFWKTRFGECGKAATEGSRAQQKALEAADRMEAIGNEATH
ncbi:hypothetical protein KJ359_011931 [Pestalotiopsis sp. 9143b]|nr:hypothetical protein KJ359_011931 [Pestalotiopsis sp. 9143b]